MKVNKLILPLLFAVAANLSTTAQKLPNKQDASLFAPANVKIDGKTTEWGTQFQAYNKATELFYTIANDNENLYLTVQAAESLIARKIIAGGLTLTISGIDKAKNNQDISITYPVFDKKNPSGIFLRNKVDASKLDSLKNASNIQLIQKAKQIKVLGIKAINDTIPLYNEHDISAASAFDDKIAYTYELALPLKHIEPIINNQGKFNYTIALNGSNQSEGFTFELIVGGMRISNPEDKPGKSPTFTDMQYIASPTNFSAEYTLAKK